MSETGSAPAASYTATIENTVPALTACMKAGVPLVQLFEEDTRGIPMSTHYGRLAARFEGYAEEYPAFRRLFRFYGALGRALELKCAWHEQAGDAVRERDRGLALRLSGTARETVDAVETLRGVWRELWDSTNKPQGFEVIDARLGGVRARMSTAADKMLAFAQGVTDDIPELSEPSLLCHRREDRSIVRVNTMDEIATPGKIDYN